jgi:hypothetical protein
MRGPEVRWQWILWALLAAMVVAGLQELMKR